ncbi:CpXC domain-containing protein [Fluviicola sp.]|uniref:CpXC domain-containing protein n=1 Tax=Fluviicola sp. TaxID=1917219 RepID=UPI003D2CA160
MSRFQEESVSCPVCAQKSTQSIATSLRISSQTDFKQQILSGNFQKFTCPNCTHSFHVDDPLIYLDFDQKIMITQFPKSWNSSWKEHEKVVTHNFENYLAGKYAAPAAREMSKGFRLRTVFGLEALAEKISCLESEIDDSLLSILKLQLIQSVDEIPFHPEFIPLLKEIKEDELVFLCPVLNSEGKIEREMMALPFPLALDEVNEQKELYESLLETFHDATYIDLGRLFFSASTESI